MAMGKVIKEGKMKPVTGGGKKMFPKQHAGPQRPGTSAHSTKGSGGKFAKGGPSGKVGRQNVSRPSSPDKVGLPEWGGKSRSGG